MINPFVRFEKRFIDAFKKNGKTFLVSQTFTREKHLFAEQTKDYIMLTHYSDYVTAKGHLRALQRRHDKYGAILNLNNEAHLTKLLEMLHPESKYIIYSSLIQNPETVKNACDTILKHNIMRYIQNQTNWFIGKSETITTKPELIFGELFIHLKRPGYEEIKVRLEEIESA